MDRFTKATSTIPNLNPTMAIHSLIYCLQPGHFLDSFFIESLDNERAAKYMTTKENNLKKAIKLNAHAEKSKRSNDTNSTTTRYEHSLP